MILWMASGTIPWSSRIEGLFKAALFYAVGDPPIPVFYGTTGVNFSPPGGTTVVLL